ncbi:MAG: uroporphyrinogen-III synthase [Proteobacteria bacterium]|nr:uroporphyrinogen-III synthase [Pseudomonadota bacterium]
MRALITRPREDAGALAKLLGGRGIECVIEPLLTIEPVKDAGLDFTGVQAVLLTSANGARALAAQDAGKSAGAWRHLAVFAVGEATASAAREAGCRRVSSAGGDVGALARLVAERLEPKGGALLHIAGTHVAGDLAGLLAKAGFTVRRAVIYEAREADCISAELISMIEAGGIDVALFFSPRTAKSFVTLAFEAGVSSACEGVTALCLSAAVAREAETIAWNEVRVAAHPDLDGLLALIDEFRRDAGLGA